MMNRIKIARVLALSSSLVLAGSFVAYRQSQSKASIDRAAGEMPLMPGSKNPSRMTVLPSSKSIDAILSNPSRTPVSPDPSILPDAHTGSDFIAPPPATSKPPGENADHLLPSSKIGPILGPDDVPITRESIDRVLNARRPEKEPAEEKIDSGKSEEKP